MTFQWFVGFYEGEGNPGYASNGKRGRTKQLRFVVVQKELRVLRKIQLFLGRRGFPSYIYPRRTSRNWMLVVITPHSRRLANQMLPYMESPWKRKQLKDALAGQFHAAASGTFVPLT